MDWPNSVCQDEFEISNLVNGNFRVPIICGYNTGEHSKLFNLIFIQINTASTVESVGLAFSDIILIIMDLWPIPESSGRFL